MPVFDSLSVCSSAIYTSLYLSDSPSVVICLFVSVYLSACQSIHLSGWLASYHTTVRSSAGLYLVTKDSNGWVLPCNKGLKRLTMSKASTTYTNILKQSKIADLASDTIATGPYQWQGIQAHLMCAKFIFINTCFLLSIRFHTTDIMGLLTVEEMVDCSVLIENSISLP